MIKYKGKNQFVLRYKKDNFIANGTNNANKIFNVSFASSVTRVACIRLIRDKSCLFLSEQLFLLRQADHFFEHARG